MSFTRFLTWFIALVLSCAAGLVISRYAFGVSNWGYDAFWMLVAAVLATDRVQDALESMWRR